MAAATFATGDPSYGFTGHLSLGQFSANVQHGRITWVAADTTCTVPLLGGGLTGTPEVYLQHNVVDKTVVPTFSGSTMTLTRSSTGSAETSVLIIYMT